MVPIALLKPGLLLFLVEDSFVQSPSDCEPALPDTFLTAKQLYFFAGQAEPLNYLIQLIRLLQGSNFRVFVNHHVNVDVGVDEIMV